MTTPVSREPSTPLAPSAAAFAAIPPLASFMPHRPPMQLVDEVVWEQDGSGEVVAWVSGDRPYFRGGRFQEFWLIEVMAQGVAAIYALAKMRQSSRPPSRGFLIAIDRFEMAPAAPEARLGDKLTIAVSLINELLPIGRYECAIRHPDGLLATAVMKFYIDDGAFQAIPGGATAE